MYPVYFSALLKSEDGRLLETGEACLSRTENKVTFKNEFVPLVKIDTTVEIVRILGNRQMERFIGTVYLSSRNLLQIVGVDPQLMLDMRKLFDINVHLPAMLSVAPGKHPVFNPKKVEIVAGTVRYLSMDIIKLSVMPHIAEGQYIMIDCEAPLNFKRTVVQVQKRELLGRRAAILICSINSMPDDERALLRASVDVLSKLEEDVDTDSEPPELDQSLASPE